MLVVDVRCLALCVERYMIRVRQCFGNQFTTMVMCVWSVRLHDL